MVLPAACFSHSSRVRKTIFLFSAASSDPYLAAYLFLADPISGAASSGATDTARCLFTPIGFSSH